METENTAKAELGYVKKRILAAVRKDYDGSDEGVFPISDSTKLYSRVADAVYSSLVEMWVLPGVATAENPPIIDENTSDDFVLSVPAIALEALICLAASKLCTEDMSNTYTRLLYRYKDLIEGLFALGTDVSTRNGFYSNAGKRGLG